MPPPILVRGWFDDALRKDEPKPSLEECKILARQLQYIVNRRKNEALAFSLREEGRTLSPFANGFIDITYDEICRLQLHDFELAAKRLLVEARKLGPEFDGYSWPCEARGIGGHVTLAEIKDLIIFIAAIAPDLENKPKRGRPTKEWHTSGREMARAITEVLKRTGKIKRISMRDKESATVKISTAAVKWAFQIRDLEPEGFASAMLIRNRTKASKSGAPTFEERFPNAKRLKDCAEWLPYKT